MRYFDYAATTKMNKEVLDTYIKVVDTYYAHPETNKTCIELKQQASEVILKNLKADNMLLEFTSGGTEANNLAIIGLAKTFESKKHFITSSYEHSSVQEVMNEVENMGHKVTYIEPIDGVIKTSDVVAAICDNTVLVSIMAVNNEVGCVNDVESIMKAVKLCDFDIKTHVDFVQGLGKIKLLNYKNIDMFSISAHKIYGPKSCGALIYKKTLKLNQVLRGGPKSSIRPGTQDLALQIAFAKAIKLLFVNYDKNIQLVRKNVGYLANKLAENSLVEFNIKPRVNIISINLKVKMQGESMVTYLSENDIVVSTKSACSTKNKVMSKTLKAIGLDAARADRTLRISVSAATTTEDMDYLVKIINEMTGE